MSHILVEWIGGDVRQFSVIKREDIANGELRGDESHLRGQTLKVNWGSRQHDAKVLDSGSQIDMDEKADELAEIEATTCVQETSGHVGSRRKKNTNRKGNGASKAEAIQNVLDLVANLTPEPSVSDLTSQIQPPKDYEVKYRNLKAKYRSLKTRYRELQREVIGEAEIELYANSGVFIKRSELDALKLLSSNPTVLARNLFRSMFSKDDLKTHTLYGRKCNANTSNNNPLLPALDAPRRDAVINYVLKEAGMDFNVGTQEEIRRRKSLKRDITRSLSDYLREVRNSV